VPVTLTTVALLCFMAATLPAVVARLLPPVPRPGADLVAGAVVVPGTGRVRRGTAWRLTPAARRRLWAGMELARARGLPLVVSGGARHGDGPTEAALMGARAARQAPELTVIEEGGSANTWESAVNCAAVLRRHGVPQVAVVTDRPHLTRAVLSFQRQGLAVEAVAASRLPSPAWMPSTGALTMLPELWYEWLALFWYELRYF
jgi:uncharacterized SAM-binding protein YcdF (DUF218 family)